MTLRDYLQNVYPVACSAQRKPAFRETTTKDTNFEIADNDKTLPILNVQGQGQAYFHNPQCINTYIIDFEQYINSFKPNTTAGRGKKCDFILASAENCSFIILNELTKSNEKYIEKKEGTALQQFKDSIEKLAKDVKFLGQFEYRVALYSCRLSSTESPNSSLVNQNLAAFNRPTLLNANISQRDVLPQGFVFQQRIYPEPFTLPEAEVLHIALE